MQSTDLNPADSQLESEQPTLGEVALLPADFASLDIRAHWVFLCLSLLVLLLSIILRVPGEEQVYLPFLREVSLPGLCFSREWLGVPCPGCGLTRSFICLGHGQLARAWHFNPAGVLMFGLVVCQVPYRSAQILRHYRGKPSLEIRNSLWIVYLIVGVLITQWVVKLFSGYV